MCKILHTLLAALFNKSQTSQGTVAAVQTLSEINAAAVAAKAKFDATYNKEKMMKLSSPEEEAKLLKKFD